MKGEYLSIETAEKIEKLKRENKELKDRIERAISFITHHSTWKRSVEQYGLKGSAKNQIILSSEIINRLRGIKWEN